MQPVTLGRLLQAAAIEEGEKALVVAGATGYSAAVLSHLGCEVTMVEEQRELADAARKALDLLGLGAIKVQTSAAQCGCASDAPYDVVLIDGAIEQLPNALVEQVAEGGCLLYIERQTPSTHLVAGMGCAIMQVKQDGAMHKHVLCDAAVPVIPAFENSTPFVL